MHTETQATENGLKIPEKASESARNPQTHLVGAQDCARRSQMGWKTLWARWTCTSTHRALKTVRKWLQEHEKSSV